MKKIITLSLLLIAILLVTGCENKLFTKESEAYINEISYKEYKKLLEKKETFIIEVMKTDCPACISFKPKLKTVANDYKVEINSLNTDNLSEEEYDELYSITGIEGTPTVLFYINGEEETTATRIVGSVTIEKIISKFKATGFIK